MSGVFCFPVKSIHLLCLTSTSLVLLINHLTMLESFVVSHSAAVKGIACVESVQARYPLMPKVAMSDMKEQLLKGSLDQGSWQQIMQGLCNKKVIHTAFLLALGTNTFHIPSVAIMTFGLYHWWPWASAVVAEAAKYDFASTFSYLYDLISTHALYHCHSWSCCFSSKASNHISLMLWKQDVAEVSCRVRAAALAHQTSTGRSLLLTKQSCAWGHEKGSETGPCSIDKPNQPVSVPFSIMVQVFPSELCMASNQHWQPAWPVIFDLHAMQLTWTA